MGRRFFCALLDSAHLLHFLCLTHGGACGSSGLNGVCVREDCFAHGGRPGELSGAFGGGVRRDVLKLLIETVLV